MDLSSSATLFSSTEPSGSWWVSFLVGCKVNQLDHGEWGIHDFPDSLEAISYRESIPHFFFFFLAWRVARNQGPWTYSLSKTDLGLLKLIETSGLIKSNFIWDQKQFFPAYLFKISHICFNIWAVRQFLLTSQTLQQFLRQVLNGTCKASWSTLEPG